MDMPPDIADLPEKLADEFLPGELKETCFVLDKRIFQWGSLNILLCGVAIGMGVGALLVELVDSAWLSYGMSAALMLVWFVRRKFIQAGEDRFVGDVRSALAGARQERPGESGGN